MTNPHTCAENYHKHLSFINEKTICHNVAALTKVDYSFVVLKIILNKLAEKITQDWIEFKWIIKLFSQLTGPQF